MNDGITAEDTAFALHLWRIREEAVEHGPDRRRETEHAPDPASGLNRPTLSARRTSERAARA
ncbi:MAG TPA: hypothetical protein VNP95_08465, partial [Thermomicrobiales bacterium]|nr:hypothetical protein [Thermomicrobiales bacterium]